MSSYREYAPSLVLRPYVECYWSREGSSPHANYRVLPDGCIDILIEIFDHHLWTSVVGTMTKAIIVNDRAWHSFIAVRFSPGGASAFFRLPMKELTDRSIALPDIWTDEAEFLDRIVQGSSPERRIQALEHGLMRRLVNIRPVDECVRRAIRQIQSRFGQSRIDDLSREIGVTRQHLTRKFEQHVGISAKFFARVVRLRRVVHSIDKVAAPDWASVALDSGYYDQAHMIGEFRDLVGVTPRSWVHERESSS